MIPLLRKKRPKNLEADFVNMLEDDNATFYRIAFSYMKNEHDALDVIQESVCKGYASLEKLKHAEYMKTWFTRILINTAINTLKKSGKVVLFEQPLPESKEDQHPDTSEERMDLQQALEQLKELEKAIVVLRFFEDYKLEEIAAALKMPLSTVKSTLYRALKKLKINFEEAYIHDS